jgi:hypothetical protein
MLQHLTHFNATRKPADVLALSFIFIFPLIAFFQLYPFHQSLKEILGASNDDWCMYIKTALDIKHNGLLIQGVTGDYDYPNGFFYSYFVAFCFTLFGESPAPVYIFQSALLGATIAFVYVTYRNKMSPLSALLFIVTLIFFAFLDVHKYYSFRFLSENLVIFTLAVFFYYLFKGIDTKKTKCIVVSAIFLGISILTRPNLFPVGIVLFLALCFFSWRGRLSVSQLFQFFFIVCSLISLLALRNKLVSGNWTFFPINSFGYFQLYFSNPNLAFEHIYKKLLFCTGFLPFLYPAFQFRPHWILMWMVYLIYLIVRLKQREKFEVFEIISHLFIFTYFGLLVFVIDAKLLTIYGFRYVIPAIFIVLPFVFFAFDIFKNRFTTKQNL